MLEQLEPEGEFRSKVRGRGKKERASGEKVVNVVSVMVRRVARREVFRNAESFRQRSGPAWPMKIAQSSGQTGRKWDRRDLSRCGHLQSGSASVALFLASPLALGSLSHCFGSFPFGPRQSFPFTPQQSDHLLTCSSRPPSHPPHEIVLYQQPSCISPDFAPLSLFHHHPVAASRYNCSARRPYSRPQN